MNNRVLLVPLLITLILPNLLLGLYSRQNYSDERIVSEERITVNAQLITVEDGNEIVEMECDTYILGVLLGEMPADFELDALKAQAVAIRTYTLRSMIRGSKHPCAAVCTDSACCQAFIDPNSYDGGEGKMEKVMQAVKETSNQVLTYQGNLIEATYFSCSGGKTEDAVAVWGTDVPYLKSVESPGEENAKNYLRTQQFDMNTFLLKLGLPKDLQLSEEDIRIDYSSGGGVVQMHIAGNLYSGVQFRTLLELPSTALSLEIADDQIVISTKGNGHRVGMSQYGAEAMAVSGKSYEEILAHYYVGTNLTTFTDEQMNAVFDKAGNL